ncbi:MAG: hypothetical protein DMF53_23425 [Acidobacteria bacterium]|nr:MAG: hypothetical protein DMF53_23425 [Acidobacteriota bacterium]
MSPRSRPFGLTALSGFFVFGAVMSGLTCILLLFPGSALDAVWRLNPQAREGLRQMGPWAVVLMATVCAACALAARGLWLRAPWGRRLALAILTVNLIGDLGSAVVREDLRTLIGLPIGGALIVYLLRRYDAPTVNRGEGP